MKKPYFFQMAVKEVSQEDGKVIIKGYASTPDIDRYQDIVEPEAFAKALELYMKLGTLLRSHDSDMPAGKVLLAKVTEKGLYIEAEVTEARTMEDVKAERMGAFSIGYIPLETELMVKKDDGSLRPFNWNEDTPWDPSVVRVIKSLDLVEISIVATPANGYALFSMAKSFKFYFNELVTKSLMKNEKKDNELAPGMEVEETKQDGADESAADEGAEGEGNGGESKDASAGDENKDESGEGETKEAAADETAAEGDETKSEAAEGAEGAAEAGDEAEKSDESSDADGDEAGDGEESKADAETGAEGSEDEAEAVEPVAVDAETAKASPALIMAGLIVEAKDGQAAVSVPKRITGLVETLAYQLLEAKGQIKTLEEKLDSIPAKQALLHNQLGETKQEGEAEETGAKTAGMFSKKEPSKAFIALIQSARK